MRRYASRVLRDLPPPMQNLWHAGGKYRAALVVLHAAGHVVSPVLLVAGLWQHTWALIWVALGLWVVAAFLKGIVVGVLELKEQAETLEFLRDPLHRGLH